MGASCHRNAIITNANANLEIQNGPNKEIMNIFSLLGLLMAFFNLDPLMKLLRKIDRKCLN